MPVVFSLSAPCGLSVSKGLRGLLAAPACMTALGLGLHNSGDASRRADHRSDTERGTAILIRTTPLPKRRGLITGKMSYLWLKMP